jgi:hypothetical protein
MQTVGSRAVYEFRKLVDESITNLSNGMSSGSMADWEQYKQFAGRIQGLREALDLMDQAESIASKVI